jgi:1-acyl-sn-glycerol-3-phosphate acyltransferase
MQAAFRWLVMLMIRVFYRTIALVHGERVPAHGPCVVVANHPNALLDPLVTRAMLRRPLAFLGKSTVFGNPIGRAVMGAFGVIPVYRPRDGADTSRNEATFERCRDLLAEGGWLMLFPEGTSHSEPTLLPVKTGAARIILSAGLASVRVLPVGLVFEAKTTFRSRVAVCIGAPIDPAPYLAEATQDERAAVRRFTEHIGQAVADAMLQAPSAELWNGFLAVAAWTGGGPHPHMDELTRRAKVLEAGYRKLAVQDPARATELVEKCQHFANLLASVGIDDPFTLSDSRPRRLGRFALLFTLLLPVVLVGLLLNVWPYQLIKLIAARATREDDVVATVKAIGGMIFYPLFWLAEAIAAGCLAGWPLGLATLVAGPTSAFVALRLLERLATRREALGGWWLRMSQAELAARLSRMRRELASAVNQALAEMTDA